MGADTCPRKLKALRSSFDHHNLKTEINNKPVGTDVILFTFKLQSSGLFVELSEMIFSPF